MDELFLQHKLSLLEFDIPETGLFVASQVPMGHIRKWTSTSDRLIFPMKICWSYELVGNNYVFTRKLQQKITKPLNIHLLMKMQTGFNYKLAHKENVIISRLLVDLRDINEGIDTLMTEANRFYWLYCHAS
jgi:hypothetical protein